MTLFHRFAALGLATALAATVIAGIAQAHLEGQSALKKSDRIAGDGLIAASFALFETATVSIASPTGGVSVVVRSSD
jgi:hypothetical protein